MTGVQTCALPITRDDYKAAVNMPDVGILIITQKTADFIRRDVDHFVLSGALPLIMEIPDKDGVVSGRLNAADYLKQAAGMVV